MTTRSRDPGEDDPSGVDLTDLDAAFAEAPSVRVFPQIPDGAYRVRVEQAEITTGTRSGHALVKWKLRILGPTCVGRLIWHNHVLSSPHTLCWLKHDLRVLGLELDKLSDLPAHIGGLVDVELDVTKRTRGTWVNVYFNRRLAQPPPRDPTPF